MQRAWCGFVFCANVIAQIPEIETERLLAKLKESRERAAAQAGNAQVAVLSRLGTNTTLLLADDPATARVQGVSLLQRSPDAKQMLNTFAERIAVLEDQTVDADVNLARARATLMRR